MRPSQDDWIDSYWMDGRKMKRFDEAWIKREVEQDQDPTTSAVSATLLRVRSRFFHSILKCLSL
jgi:hypothetical protein